MSLYITIEGAEELVRKLTTLEQMRHVRAVIQQEGRFLAGKLRKYPQKAQYGNPLIRADARVRRGFFYHLNHGDISVPYKRGGGGSERLGTRWTVKSENQGWQAIVGNNASYAHLVQGEETQTFGHGLSGWLTDKGAVNVYGPVVQQNIRAAVEKEVRNVG
jgi:hypothetical protein